MVSDFEFKHYIWVCFSYNSQLPAPKKKPWTWEVLDQVSYLWGFGKKASGMGKFTDREAQVPV